MTRCTWPVVAGCERLAFSGASSSAPELQQPLLTVSTAAQLRRGGPIVMVGTAPRNASAIRLCYLRGNGVRGTTTITPVVVDPRSGNAFVELRGPTGRI